MRKSQNFYKVYKIHILHDTNKNVNNSATLNSFVRFFFWRRFADHSSNLALGVLLKFPNMSRHSGRWCGSMILLLVFLFTFFFTATHFHPAGRQHFSFYHHRYKILMLFLQRDKSPLFLVSRFSSFSVIQVSIDRHN